MLKILVNFFKLGDRPSAGRSSQRDAVILGTASLAVCFMFETQGLGAELFESLPGDVHTNLESHFFTGVAMFLGLAIFAVRRWIEATHREAMSRHDAQHDVTTGILNRRGFLKALGKGCNSSHPDQIACILFDLDGFKAVNDTYGHPVGDALLRAIPQRIAPLLPPKSVFARFSGDEFALIVPLAVHEKIAKLILHSVSQPFEVEGKRLEVGTSVGLALCPHDATDAAVLLRKADLALYKSKQTGRGRVTAYNQAIDNDYLRQTELERALRAAIAADEIVPFYQPLVCVESNGLLGFEVLARWKNRTLGQIPPADFIPVAARLGLIAELSENIMRRALTEAAQWDQPFRLSFNIAPQQLTMPSFPSTVLKLAEDAGCDPARIDIEVTEESFISHPELVSDVVFILKQYGVTFSLDDFGVGYSSLGQLLNIPFDTIKIDRSFVARSAMCPKSRALLETMVRLGHSVGTSVLAEGIETIAERDLVTRLGCDKGQGWLYGRPSRTPDFTHANVRSLFQFRTRALL